MSYVLEALATGEEQDMLVALCMDAGALGCEHTSQGIKIYTEKNTLRSVQEALQTTGIHASEAKEIKRENWNKVWESNYEAVSIDNKVLILPDHLNPTGKYEHIIRIQPQQSFGTGHHETTQLMINAMLDIDFKGRRVLDAGTGTGVLAILAVKLGALSVLAIDSDQNSCKNTRGNRKRNKLTNEQIMISCEDLTNFKPNRHYDVVLANIQLNVLLAGSSTFYNCVNENGILAISGIMDHDIAIFTQHYEKCGWGVSRIEINNSWAIVVLNKNFAS